MIAAAGMAGCRSEPEDAKQLLVRDLVEKAKAQPPTNGSPPSDSVAPELKPELPIPEKVENLGEAKELMLAVQSRINETTRTSFEIGSLQGSVGYLIQKEARWVNGMVEFPPGTSADAVLDALPDVVEATPLRHFAGLIELAKESSSDRTWFKNDGEEYATPIEIANHIENSLHFSGDPSGTRGPRLMLAVQVREE